MLEGPYSSTRWRDRLEGAAGILVLLGAVANVIYFIIAGFQLLTAGAYLKLALIAASVLTLFPLALRMKLPFAFLALFALVGIIFLIQAYVP